MKPMTMESPIGPLTIVGDENGLQSLSFGARARDDCAGSGIVREAIVQLHAYFAGKRTRFDLPLNPEGTPFQKEVWQELQEVMSALKKGGG